ncbi:sulfotransferase [Roseivivax sp. CAU 1753]
MTQPAPVIVLAAPGAGGQVVASALGRNAAAFDLPVLNAELEDTIYAMVFEMQGVRAAQLHGTLRALAYLLSGEQSLHSVDMARRWLMRRLHLSSAELAHWVCARLSPRRAIVPVASGLFSETARNRLAEIYRGADLLIVTRDPASHEAAVMSDHAGAAATLLGAYDTAEPGAALPDPARLRSMAEDGMEHLLGSMPDSPVHHVHFDDLLRDPEAELRRLAKALALPHDPAQLARMRHPERSPFATVGPYGAHGRGDIHPLGDQLRAAHAPA